MIEKTTHREKTNSKSTVNCFAPTPRPERERNSGFKILKTFQRFNQRNDIFCRSMWDDTVRSEKSDSFYETYRDPLKNFRNADGFGQKDFAIRNAAWHITNIFAEMKENEDRREGFLDEFSIHVDGSKTKLPTGTPEETSAEIKRVAKLFGADLVGITQYDERWLYTKKYSRQNSKEKPNEIPPELKNVIVIATQMDHDLIKTVPSALSGAATGVGYSKDSIVLLALAQYIRNLGYQAIATMNDSALAIPLAIQAGLGEYGRHGMLITKEFGPRVRLGKVFTDLPLTHDQPISFGVREFCEICRRCSKACPPKAITNSIPSAAVYNRSNIVGIRKWSVDAEKCFGFWVNQNSDCSICIRICPYNKDYSSWIYRVGRWLAGTRLRKLMLRLDIALGFGARETSTWWWQQAANKSSKFDRK